jgi:Protein of unknown function (DUF3300)/Chaperone of endosialidase
VSSTKPVLGKTSTINRLLQLLVLAILLGTSLLGRAALAETAAAASPPPRTAAQLEQLAAPIALYPDALLSQVLMASTYPLEVVAAARWSQSNLTVKGEALEAAMRQQSWDPSVKGLTAVPQVLQMMNDKIEWTQQLGDAALAQQSELLDAVQRLRGRADANGQLKSTPEQKVTKTARRPAPGVPAQKGPAAPPADVYAIEPAVADQYSVPIYDPSVVYGAWPYPDYEPFYWYPPGYAVGAAWTFAGAALVGSAIWGSINWGRNNVGINPLRYNQFNRTNIGNGNWVHNPAHRGAVPYRDAGVAQRFGNRGNNTAARDNLRNRTNAGNQPRPKQTGNAGPKQTGGAKTANRANRTTGSNKAASNRQGSRSRQAGISRPNAGRATAGPSGGARVNAGNLGGRSMGGRGFSGGRSMGGARGGARGGGRRSDIRLKHDIVLLGRLSNGLGFYRFAYNDDDRVYVGVMAQEVQTVMSSAVIRGQDGYLRVFYNQVGLTFQTYDQWLAGGARIPAIRVHH